MPLVQEQGADLPAALLLLTLSLLFGLPGLILAAPLTVTLIVLVRAAHVEGWLESDRA